MFLRNFALSAAMGALTLAFAPMAHATTFPLGTIPNFYITSGTPFSDTMTANFGNGFSVSQSFDDSFTFNIPVLSGTGSNSISTSFSSAANHLVITGFWVNDTLYTVPSTDSGQSLTINDLIITAGKVNTIRVLGTTGTSGGSYSGTVTFSAMDAVPEPAIWAMMLMGFGAVGGITRRRFALAKSPGLPLAQP